MKLKLQKPGVGRDNIIKWVVIVLMILLLSMNFFISITRPYPILKALYLTVPYLIIILVAFFCSYKSFLTVTFLIVALISAIDQTGHVDYSGSIFFFLSFYVRKNNKYGIFIIVITIISISIRSYVNNFSIFQAFNLTLAYTAVYSISYLLVIKKNIIKLSEAEEEIIVLVSSGKSQKEAGYSLGLDQSQVNYLIKNIRKNNNNITLNQVMFLYGKARS